MHLQLTLKTFFLFFLPCIACSLYGQLTGNITDANGQPLQDVSVHLENTFIGTVSNSEGIFYLNPKEETSGTIVFTYLGYQTQAFPFDSTTASFEVVLQPEIVQLDEVTLNAQENPAHAIIRAAQRERKKHLEESKVYTADFYSKGIFGLEDVPERFMGQEVGDLDGVLDSTRSGILYLSETKSKIFSERGNFKEVVYASKVSGNDNGFSFNTAEDADFNFYKNTLDFGNQLVSPIATNAFAYYRYTLEDSFYTSDRKLINRIAVQPKTATSPAFEGIIYIVEDDWTLYGVDLTVEGKRTQLLGLNSMQLQQQYLYNSNTSQWRKANQVLDFTFGFLGFKGDGRFSAVYSNYNTAPQFAPKTFNRTIQTIESGANKKSTAYWDKQRPIPLLEKEIQDYVKKDSLQQLRKSEVYQDSIDRKNNRFKWSDIIQKEIQNSKKNSRVKIEFPLARAGFNPIQGGAYGLGVFWRRDWEEKKSYAKFGVANDYGVSDKKHYPKINASYRFNSTNYNTLILSAGRYLEQFNNRPAVSKTINTVANLFFKEHYAHYLEKEKIELQWSLYPVEGLFTSYSVGYQQRTPRQNTSNFSYRFKDRDYPENTPRNSAVDFEQHNLLFQRLLVRYAFGYKLYKEPNRVFYNFDSTYPTLRLFLTNGSGSSVERYNFTKLDLRLSHKLNFGALGSTRYALQVGGFLQKEKPSFDDLQHFNGNETPIANATYRAFNLLPYYERSTAEDYATFHLTHDFYKWGVGSWPLIKQLQGSLIAGIHGLAISGSRPYGEFNIGLGNLGFGQIRGLSLSYVRAFGAVDRPDGFFIGFKL